MCSALVSSKSLLRKERKVSKQKQMFTFNFLLCVDWGDWGRGVCRAGGNALWKPEKVLSDRISLSLDFAVVFIWPSVLSSLLLLFKDAVLLRER